MMMNKRQVILYLVVDSKNEINSCRVKWLQLKWMGDIN